MTNKNYLLYLSGVISESQYLEGDAGLSNRKSTLVKQLHQAIEPLTKGIFSDNSWQPVHAVFGTLGKMVNVQPMGSNYMHDEEGRPNGKVWKFEVHFINQNNRQDVIYGRITASGAGSVQEPLERYDVVVTMS